LWTLTVGGIHDTMVSSPSAGIRRRVAGMTPENRCTGDAAAARRIVDAVTNRAALHEAIGVVLARGGRDRGDVMEQFCGDRSTAEREAEVAWVNAGVDAAADRSADPDWED
jgi:hypothetical protein